MDHTEFIDFAFNAHNVLKRRGWNVIRMAVPYKSPPFRWTITHEDQLPWQDKDGGLIMEGFVWDDPFTALIEADKWYRENVEAK